MRITVSGIVQGVGFRPFVWQRANKFGLSGWVENDSSGVTMEVQGGKNSVAGFISGLVDELPPLANVDSLKTTEIAVSGEAGFEIVESRSSESNSTPVSPDISVCDNCLDELQNPANRRFRYPFINCTNCGPRFTILQDIPYDRPLTTMKSFLMCDACRNEYDNPADRRFHAQPNACNECGPHVWFVSNSDIDQNFTRDHDASVPTGDDAIQSFHSVIGVGKIVAVKGIGGFHLACDATNDEAIDKLRQRKGRVDKPFALMVNNVNDCLSFAVVGDQERVLLESRQRPIVLLKKRTDSKSSAARISRLVAPGNDFIGVMLAYSPMHYLLSENENPLIMTSGNLSDEPIVRTNSEAQKRLSAIADCFVLHDRDIEIVCDDSVVRCVNRDILPIRRSRGYSPMPVKLRDSGPAVLSVGGEIKATFCATKNDYAYVSQHIGDMGNLETLEAMKRSIDHILRLFRIEPDLIAADLHPEYFSTRWAREFARSLSVPFFQVQHHHAHVAALIAEHKLPSDQPVIGVCFDGTGFGSDGAIWGGEVLVADARQFKRYAHLQYIPLSGGDASIRRPYKSALAHLSAADIKWDQRLPCVKACEDKEGNLLRQQLEKNINCVPTSSMGRLFDAVAALIGIRQTVSYEAQAAMEMEALAADSIDDPTARKHPYTFQIQTKRTTATVFRLQFRQICTDVISGIDNRIIAARFHLAVANLVVDVCVAAREEFSINQVGLTGGVFQNVLLLKLTMNKLRDAGFVVHVHKQVPPNDGGIALGQALIGQHQ